MRSKTRGLRPSFFLSQKNSKFLAFMVDFCTNIIYTIDVAQRRAQAQHTQGGSKMTQYRESAWSLYDGGWRAADSEWLAEEYDLTAEETAALVAELAECERLAK
nr:MAG TPA: hypothetical protein [Caudoviricetes sp.]